MQQPSQTIDSFSLSLEEKQKDSRLNLGGHLCHNSQRRDYVFVFVFYYDITLVTTPAPTVMPPSRMEKRVPSEMTVGAISFTFMEALSPGKHAATPSGRLISPVTFAVRTKNCGRYPEWKGFVLPPSESNRMYASASKLNKTAVR